ncbi:hypothetical protein MIMGU_mgv1a016454mg [Erythranthe guttata]|uniref:Uncharacterized protein n=1 Tax=Erythranthe guttata TaxID=4155 RepID=A0A022PXF9_ERYGU|nr:hypothetical protein MIMGU_mgv1a016454mg [Erythranthe guttata]
MCVYIYFQAARYWPAAETYFLDVRRGTILMTRPGKTSSGSCICGFLSTMYGSPHFSLIVLSVSPSPTTYISSHGRSAICRPLTTTASSSSVEAELVIRTRAIKPTQQNNMVASATAADAFM